MISPNQNLRTGLDGLDYADTVGYHNVSQVNDSQDLNLLFAQVQKELNSKLAYQEMSDEQIEAWAIEYVYSQTLTLPNDRRDVISKGICDRLLRFGALQVLIDDPEVSEIMVSGGGKLPDGRYLPPKVFTERSGVNRAEQGVVLNSEAELMQIVSRLASKTGRRCDESSPLMNAQLPDGSRVNAVHHSISIDGQTLNIRKFKLDAKTPVDLVRGETCSPNIMNFLQSCVKARCNIIISGGTGSGKTTLLNVLSSFIPRNEHIVVIEDTAELQLYHPHIDRLQARQANAEGKGLVTMHDLLVNSLRMKPDRIVVGECRSSETLEMLQAMQTGHDGSLTTIHSNSASAALLRIETLVKSDSSFDVDAIRSQIAQAIDLVVHTRRRKDGSRIIEEIISVDSYTDSVLYTSTIFQAVINDIDGCVSFNATDRQPLDIRRKILEAGQIYNQDWFFQQRGM